MKKKMIKCLSCQGEQFAARIEIYEKKDNRMVLMCQNIMCKRELLFVVGA